MNSTQYYSSPSYANVLLNTIVQAFIDPKILAQDVVNIVVFTADDNYHRVYFRQMLSSSIVASYTIKLVSRFPTSVYSTQLIFCGKSGLFTTNLQANARAMGAAGFLTASSDSIQVGKHKTMNLVACFNNIFHLSSQQSPLSSAIHLKFRSDIRLINRVLVQLQQNSQNAQVCRPLEGLPKFQQK